MKQVTLAWWFETPKPLTLTRVRKALAPLGITWTEHDCEWKSDSISGALTKSARARIFEIGLQGFVVNLTIEAQQDPDLEAKVAEAKEKLLGEVLPLLDAREITESEPEED